MLLALDLRYCICCKYFFFFFFCKYLDISSELYGREYDQGKVTYNDVYFQQKSL